MRTSDLPGRMAVRTPMQWRSGKLGGFSMTNDPEQLCRPFPGPPYSPDEVNVVAQRHDPDSLFSFVRERIRCYRECPELGWGVVTVLDHDVPSALVHRSDWAAGPCCSATTWASSRSPLAFRSSTNPAVRCVSICSIDRSGCRLRRTGHSPSTLMRSAPDGFGWSTAGPLSCSDSSAVRTCRRLTAMGRRTAMGQRTAMVKPPAATFNGQAAGSTAILIQLPAVPVITGHRGRSVAGDGDRALFSCARLRGQQPSECPPPSVTRVATSGMTSSASILPVPRLVSAADRVGTRTVFLPQLHRDQLGR